MKEPLRLGISTCLLGEHVRYDGGHRLDPFIVKTLGKFVDFVPVCPEVECGLGIPREAMHLEGDPLNPRLVTRRSKIDHTDRMTAWAGSRVKELAKENLDGFVFKSNSPSSGMQGVKVYNQSGMPEKKGVGLFARAFIKHFPLLPVEDDGRLHDPGLRENFIERIFASKRWRDFLTDGPSRGNLVAFHTREKLFVLAHSPKHYQMLGRLVAESRKVSATTLYSQYEKVYMEALRLKATVKKNVNVLQHMMGYFKGELSPDEKGELRDVIEQYHREYVPLIVPVTLLRHYVRKYDQPYLKDQVYLNPHPIELKLRNHV